MARRVIILISVDFIVGFFMHSAIVSLFQDIMGKERYIEFAQNNWISPWITVPIAGAMLIAGVVYIVRTWFQYESDFINPDGPR